MQGIAAAPRAADRPETVLGKRARGATDTDADAIQSDADSVATPNSRAQSQPQSQDISAFRLLYKSSRSEQKIRAEAMLAQANTPHANELLGLMRLFDRDGERQTEAYERFAASGNDRARAYAATCKGMGIGTQRNHAVALRDLLAVRTPLADKLAGHLVCAPGVPRDEQTESIIFNRLKHTTDEAAQAICGTMLIRGIGTRRKLVEGAIRLHSAGTDRAQYELGMLLASDRSRHAARAAIRFFDESALPEAKSALAATLPEVKAHYITRDRTALERRGDAEAGMQHGGPVDGALRRAADYYANSGSPSALRKLALLHFDGRGRTVDVGTAFDLCKQSDAAANPLPMLPPPPRLQRNP